MDFEDYQCKVRQARARYDLACKTVKTQEEELDRLMQDLQDAEKARKIIQEVAQKVEEMAAERFSAIVTKCLECIFDNPYEFRFVFEKKRGKTEARPCFFKDGQEVTKVGGSVKQVTAFALRLTDIVLSRPPKERLMCMDEPFLALDADNITRVAGMISQLSHELNVQFVLASHAKPLMIGNIIRLGGSNNEGLQTG